MKYICAQPANQYFGWQLDVMLHSFITTGVNPSEIDVISSTIEGIDDYFTTLMQKYTGVNFSFYEDTRDFKGYIPSIKQHLLAKHLRANPELQHCPIMLHDADIALTRPIKLENLLKDNIWYFSDTISYLNHSYILSKGRDVLEKMLEIADISEDIVRSNNNNAGGAQYLMKNVTPELMDEVVEMSHKLWIEMSAVNEAKDYGDDYPLQIWTAEMWAMLWVPWKKGIMTAVAKDLDFCWATDPKDKWHSVSIYHNAGVTEPSDIMFHKGTYIHQMPDLDLNLKAERCSYHYYNLLKSALG